MPTRLVSTSRSSVKLEGVQELKANLERLGNEVATKIGVRANTDAARLLADAVREAAPYAERESTRKYWKLKNGQSRSTDYGHLRDNIRVRRQLSRKQGHIVHWVTTGNAFWAWFLEFGTSLMRAHPFFRPVIDRMHNVMLGAQIDGLRDGIERETKKMERRLRRRSR